MPVDPASSYCRFQSTLQNTKESRSLQTAVFRNITKFKSMWWSGINITYNWDRFVLGPEFAIDSTPLPLWVKFGLNSSSKGFCQIDSPPSPVPLGSPPWICKHYNSKSEHTHHCYLYCWNYNYSTTWNNSHQLISAYLNRLIQIPLNKCTKLQYKPQTLYVTHTRRVKAKSGLGPNTTP